MNKQALRDAVKRAEIWTDGHEDGTGILFEVGKLRTLTLAARYALEVVDFDNPPLLTEDLGHMQRRRRSQRALSGAKRITNRKPGLAKVALPEAD